MRGSVKTCNEKNNIVYEEDSILIAKFNHPKSDDYLDYKSKITIKNSGKMPIEMTLKFDGIYPFAAPMPPEKYKIKAASILDLHVKTARWFKKYGYKIK